MYLTTNYDDRMTQALAAQGKKPRREMCRWNDALKGVESAFDAPAGFTPDASNPLVYHLYGHDGVTQSLVLTEDDHLDYLVRVSAGKKLPPRVEEALAWSSLLFLGYHLDSLTFRVLFRGIIHSMEGKMKTLNVAVQTEPVSQPHVEYLVNYHEMFADVRTTLYWGTPQEFARELADRWSDFRDDA
ncbi:MAG: SIR2 family protein [Anaerolineae bacterium]|nr:SIR2 family protein [Anaerolineae bacterium]